MGSHEEDTHDAIFKLDSLVGLYTAVEDGGFRSRGAIPIFETVSRRRHCFCFSNIGKQRLSH